MDTTKLIDALEREQFQQEAAKRYPITSGMSVCRQEDNMNRRTGYVDAKMEALSTLRDAQVPQGVVPRELVTYALVASGALWNTQNMDAGPPLHEECIQRIAAEGDALWKKYKSAQPSPAVSLKKGEYGVLWKHLEAGGEALGATILNGKGVACRCFRNPIGECCLNGLAFDNMSAFVAECTRLGLQYVMIQPETK